MGIIIIYWAIAKHQSNYFRTFVLQNYVFPRHYDSDLVHPNSDGLLKLRCEIVRAFGKCEI